MLIQTLLQCKYFSEKNCCIVSPVVHIAWMGYTHLSITNRASCTCPADRDFLNYLENNHSKVERTVVGHDAMVRECRFAVRFQTSLGAGYIMFLSSQSWDIVAMLCPWAKHFTLKWFTWLRWKWVPGRTEMAICTISSMFKNGCSTECSPWSWNGTRMNRSSDQRVKCKIRW